MAMKLGLAILMMGAVVANAASYEVNVTRKASNIYKVDGKSVLIQTRYCYVYGYSEEAILRSNGLGGELLFVSSRDKCDVKAVYGRADVPAGRYGVRVSYEADDWYEIQGKDLYIQTSACLDLSLGQQATLTLQAGGFGRVAFEDGQSCMVEGVMTKMKLD